MKFVKRATAFLCILVLCLSVAVFAAACNNDDGTEQGVTFVKAKESADGYATLYVPEGKSLDVMVLSDPQVDYTEKYKAVGSPGNETTYAFIEDFVRATDPDFVVINGDLVMLDTPFASQVPYFDRYAEIFERLEVPWTFTSGNHDSDHKWQLVDGAAADDPYQCSKAVLTEHMSQYKHCLVSSDEDCADGEGNHFVNVRTYGGGLIYTMCMFDCVDDGEHGDYSAVPTAAQVDWYRDTINALSDTEYGADRSADEVVKSVIFNHVGIPEFKTAWDEAWNGGVPTDAYHYGVWLHGDYTSKYGDMPESGQIFSVAKELGSTTAIFMCHHHDNDFSVDYQGIRLTFGQHSGYSHSYRTTQDKNGGGAFNADYSLKYWEGIDFSRIDDYGDDRGGTRLVLSADGTFGITPVYARDVLDNYLEKYYIDYDAVAAAIEASEYTGTVARGTGREWKTK